MAKFCGSGSGSADTSKSLKRNILEKESSLADLLTVAKKRREVTNDGLDDRNTDEKCEDEQKGCDDQEERAHSTNYIGVRWSRKKAKWR